MKWLDKNQNKILIAIWSAIFLTCLLVIFSEPVKASSTDSLPYYVNKNVPNEYPFTFASACEHNINLSQNSSIYQSLGITLNDLLNCDNYILVKGNQTDYYIYYTYHILLGSDYSITLSNNSYDNFNTSIDYVTLKLRGSGSNSGKYISFPVRVKVADNSWVTQGITYNSNNDLRLFYGGSIPYEIKDTFYTGDLPVLTNYSEPLIITGHATEPINDPNNLINDGSGNPIIFRPNKPNPTPFTPQPFNPPSLDTSTLETLVESLIDIVEYGFNYIGGVISGSFSNLLSNLGSWVDYIVESFNFGFNNVVKAIQNLATDFYNNMVSLFEPLYEFFNGVATFFNNLIQLGIDGDSFSLSTFFYNLLVPDPEEFSQTLLDGDFHHVVPLVQAVRIKFVSLFDSFYNLTPTKVFLIPSFSWHGQTFNLSIDFSWYDDYKVYGDSIIAGFLVIGYIYWFVLQLNSMFRGGNSIGHDISKVGGKE